MNVFIACCRIAGTPTTIRQLSKFRNKKGLAYKKRLDAVYLLAIGRKTVFGGPKAGVE
jgi:hypothetical protein